MMKEAGKIDTKVLTTVVGILLIFLGIVVFIYKDFSYTEKETIAKIGDVQVTADTQKKIPLSPVLGGLSIVAGVVLVFLGRRNGK